jgi:hypothetical protein
MTVSAALIEAIVTVEVAVLVLTTGLLTTATAFRERLAHRRPPPRR